MTRRLGVAEALDREERKIRLRCPWFGCRAEIEVYRSQMVWGRGRAKAALSRFVFCPDHRAAVKNLIGTGRMNGLGRVFADPDRVYYGRIPASQALRVAIFELAGRKCGACKVALVFSERGKTWFIDHVVPVSLGGLTTLKNLQPLCGACHRAKTAGEIKEIRRLMPNTSRREWATHAEKDQTIAALTREIVALRARLGDS